MRASAWSEGRLRASTRVGGAGASSSSCSSTSPGSEMNTGPVGGVSATFAARRTISGRSAARVTSTAHLTSGCAIGTSGAYSSGSSRPWPCSCWPAVRISGEPENFAL